MIYLDKVLIPSYFSKLASAQCTDVDARPTSSPPHCAYYQGLTMSKLFPELQLYGKCKVVEYFNISQ